MSLSRRASGWLCLLPLLALLAVLSVGSWHPQPRSSAAAEPEDPPPDGGRPALAVLVVFDQMRGDYLTRWEGQFGEGGFRRLGRDGAWFQDCHYPYALTVTGPGHASIATGCSPMKHGIVANDWYDRAAGQSVYCVGTDRYERVPPGPAAASDAPGKPPRGSSPDRLLSPTLGDALKDATSGAARVVALSFKDRAAVLPGGRRADACYWLDTNTGTFVTSTYYADQVNPWVTAFNHARPADRWFGHTWERLRPDLDYAAYSGPDDVPGEGTGAAQGRTFPHPLTGGATRPGSKYYAALYNSPFGNNLLLDLVKRAIDGEHLGRHDAPDLLCVSFSCNDPVGHCWGPDSQEVMDVTLRSDRIVRDLLAYLDARVGKGRYVLALTADHGVCPLPEVSQAQGKEAARVAPEQLTRRAEEALDASFGANPGKARWLAATPYPWIYLNQDVLRRRGLQSSGVEEAMAGWLKEQPGIQSAITRGQLLRGVPSEDASGQAVRRSFRPERSGDVFVLLKPYHLLTGALTGTTHGTPHPYDTHVPLLVYGPGIRPGVRRDAVTPQAAAAILAHALEIPPPADAEAPVPEDLFIATPPG
jgi:hypothetical protein